MVRRTRAEIVWEIRSLLAQGIDCFHTCDSEFNVPIGHAEAVCESIIGAGLDGRIAWYAYASPAAFTRRLAAQMRRAGCVGVNFGADSGSDAMLAALGRDFDTTCLAETVQICRDCGIISMFDILLGGPGETRETLAETLDLVAKRERLTAPELADYKELAVNSASNRLKRLYDQRLIRREYEISDKGLQYIYRFWEWTEAPGDLEKG